MEEQASDRAAVFERWAAGYDDFVAQGRFPLDAHPRVVEAVLEQLALRPGVRVLELGAGTGLLTARLLGAGAEVVAVDVSPAMLDRARARAPGAQFHRLDVTTPDWSEALPSVDRIVATYLLHEFPLPRQRAVLEAAARCLMPGGWIVAGDVGFATVEAREAARIELVTAWDPDEHYWAGPELLRAFDPRWSATYRDCGPHGGVVTVRPGSDEVAVTAEVQP